ncbi:class I SAM-dependent methyltransferase [Solibacillus sp. FSL R7-0682]|uniref:class I SAM-dependent methyltransferase n=1 Tax=Solibacillus sp. FSL R7-0682 TaxID=2921690 RepID=UPI0030FC4714
MIPSVYDQVNSFSKYDEFFLALLERINVKKLADLGCGTGRLTRYFAEAGYQITAVDPNEEAIEIAKTKGFDEQVEWVVGDSTYLQSNSFDTVIMTANVAQVFLTDESWEKVIFDVYNSLKPGGHFIFDTRNPLTKVWESWQLDTTPDYVVDEKSGESLKILTHYEDYVDGVFTFYETVKNATTNEILDQVKMQLKFRTEEALHHSLTQVGFSDIVNYGDAQFERATNTSNSFIFHCIK